jgi:hypothetical protein
MKKIAKEIVRRIRIYGYIVAKDVKEIALALSVDEMDVRRTILTLCDEKIIGFLTSERRLVASYFFPKTTKKSKPIKMKLKTLKKLIDTAIKKAGKCDPYVELWHREKRYHIDEITQFGVVPDVNIHISPDE